MTMSLSESQRSIHPNSLAVRQCIGPGSKKVSSLLGVCLCPFGRLSVNIRRKLNSAETLMSNCLYSFLDFCLVYISFLVTYTNILLHSELLHIF